MCQASRESTELLKRLLKEISNLNKRAFMNSASLKSFFEDLETYRSSTKMKLWSRLLEILENQDNQQKDLQRLLDAWRMLSVSEELYNDALKIEQLRRSDNPHTIVEHWQKPNKPEEKKANKQQSFFNMLRSPNYRKKNKLSFNDKAAQLIISFERNLEEDIHCFATNCKRYGLICTQEDSLKKTNAKAVKKNEKRFHDRLWMLRNDVKLAMRKFGQLVERLNLCDRTTTYDSADSARRMRHCMDEWHIYQAIAKELMTCLEELCAALETPDARILHSSAKRVFDPAFCTERESNVNKLLIDKISNVIVQMRVHSSFQCLQSSIRVEQDLKDCLNLFRSRRTPIRLCSHVDDSDDNVFLP